MGERIRGSKLALDNDRGWGVGRGGWRETTLKRKSLFDHLLGH